VRIEPTVHSRRCGTFDMSTVDGVRLHASSATPGLIPAAACCLADRLPSCTTLLSPADHRGTALACRWQRTSSIPRAAVLQLAGGLTGPARKRGAVDGSTERPHRMVRPRPPVQPGRTPFRPDHRRGPGLRWWRRHPGARPRWSRTRRDPGTGTAVPVRAERPCTADDCVVRAAQPREYSRCAWPTGSITPPWTVPAVSG
jgi:hypothetical protein